MFGGCTNLITAPSLPATTVANLAYAQMFYNCKKLTTTPDLPATTISKYSYQAMFMYCTSLTSAPSLLATTLGRNCYYMMFRGCANLTTVPSLPALNLSTLCYSMMFYDCAKIKLSAVQTSEYTQAYRIPIAGAAASTSSPDATSDMFTITGGTFTGTPSINTTYYLSNTNTIV